MDLYTILGVILAVIVAAFLLGLRDRQNARKRLTEKLNNNYGKAPEREYKEGELSHITGYFKKHTESFYIDDITWNDLDMDSVYKRMNYCLSAAGEEYLYYMLRCPEMEDDFAFFEEQVQVFLKNRDFRLRMQLIYADIGKSSKYSIYDYLDFLDSARISTNARHFVMLLLMALSVLLCFFNFALGFVALIVLMLAQIVMYFQIKAQIDPYLVTYGYIMRVIKGVGSFSGVREAAFAKDMEELKKAASELGSFKAGADIILSPTGMNSSGNPVDLVMDYVRMVTHIDIIKFNQMYRQIMQKKDRLDDILRITGRIEAEISVACFRASFDGRYSLPEFTGSGYDAKELIHPLIESAVPNDITTKRGVLLTGSNASGKSTFLKTCAINACLSQSIHTSLSSSYRAPFYRVYSSMALRDDIFMGESYYMVEIKSIKRILDAAGEEGARVLCFVDEVLRGTNTVERIAASTEILRELSARNVTCFAATHDIELTALLDDCFDVCHFEGDISGDDVKFDYRIRSGASTTRNAIKLLGVLGYDLGVVEKAQKKADAFTREGKWEKT